MNTKEITFAQILKEHLHNPLRSGHLNYNPEKGLTIREFIDILSLIEDQELEIAIRHEGGGTDFVCLDDIIIDDTWSEERNRKCLFLKQMG